MNADRLAEIKARLEAATQGEWRSSHTGRVMASPYIEIPLTYHDSDLIANAPADLRDLITALEAAQERSATLEAEVKNIIVDDIRSWHAPARRRQQISLLEAEVQRVRSDHQYIIGHNAGFDDAWAQRGEEIKQVVAQRDALRNLNKTRQAAAAMPTQAYCDACGEAVDV